MCWFGGLGVVEMLARRPVGHLCKRLYCLALFLGELLGNDDLDALRAFLRSLNEDYD